MTLTELLREHSPHVARLALRVRDVIRATLPDAEERVYPGWHGIGYRDPTAGYVCAIFPKTERVEVGFERGADLPDPNRLLVRGGKQVRYMVISELDETLEKDLQELIETAVFASR